MSSLVAYFVGSSSKKLSSRHTVGAASIMVAIIVTSSCLVRSTQGGFPRDVELIEPMLVLQSYPSTSNRGWTEEDPSQDPNETGSYDPGSYYPSVPAHLYPSYVKGQDPVEEYNRRRLHIDTSNYLDDILSLPEWDRKELLDKHRKLFEEQFLQKVDDNPKVEDYADNTITKNQKQSGKLTKNHRRKINKQNKEPIKRTWYEKPLPLEEDDVTKVDQEEMENVIEIPKLYEESDPHVFGYGNSPGRSVETRRQKNPQEDLKYFQDTYCEQKSPLELEFGHLYETNDGWEERYERQDHKNHRHQGKVKWADKNGGFGEHYWDLNHVA
ncbi:uncharacterized protein LOC129754949 [Uranotaenia lowii]|uniref:uncharacterized protein LOC129754949 n=1 Tax=Uranotaenia lowii TaxID=190385 RepID=UPI00247ACA67|nr:uncharacterized protein LOC129754949 [Uranotaenia lowii]